MREIVLGTAGHVDHGKTSLVKALTGIDTDRLKEEKERGITIELGFAFIDLPCGHRLGIVDVPGHEKFIKNMVAGAAGIDIVAFVIAADEGVMPQTREHFEICSLLGVGKGCVIITKKDMVEPDWLDLVFEETKEFFAGSFLEDAPMVAVSSTTGEGIAEVRQVFDQLVSSCEFQEAYGPFRLPVDRVFTMKGFGSVVTGTSISGRTKVGDDITIYPGGISGKIRGIQVHSADVNEVEAGNRTAINIQGIEKEMIDRGDIIATPGSLDPSYMLDADLVYLAGNKKALKNRTRVRVHIGTAEIMGRVVLLEDEELAPGSQANVQLLLEKPIGIWPGDRYVIRSYSPVYTIGGGVLFHASAQKKRRFRAENKEIFRCYRKGSPEDHILMQIRESGFDGLTLEQLSVKSGIFGNKIKKILNAPISARKILVIDSEKQRMIEESVYEKIKAAVQEILVVFHQQNPMQPGLSKEELRSRLFRGLDQRLFQFALHDLSKQGVIATEGAVIRMAGHEISFAADEESLRKDIEALYKKGGLMPPTVKETVAEFSKFSQKVLFELLGVLVREAILIKVSEDLYFHAGAVADLKEKLHNFLKENGEIDAQGFKSLTGITRKFSIPLLEYFDKVKLTIRVGNTRVLRK
ncbi:MAG: selenocysteine-specific translation elongation factor [Desulfobulbaceae bacterium]|nr:selenocysteine-specific translation elongation factor [Desulfobulbaceae bacterium]